MNLSTQFPALMGKTALPALSPAKRAAKLAHPLGLVGIRHPLVASKRMETNRVPVRQAVVTRRPAADASPTKTHAPARPHKGR